MVEGSRSAILIVEDDADMREVVSDVLSTGGYEVRRAVDGAEALKILESDTSIGLVLLDLMLPVMDGWQFLAAYRHLPPERREAPVVVLTATADAISAGEVDYVLQKPVEMDQLLEVVGSHLRWGRRRAVDPGVAQRYGLTHRDRAYEIGPGRGLVVGREAGCDVVLRSDHRVSRRHARFFLEGAEAFVEDLASRNGVLVNGRIITQKTQIVPGDRVAVGLEVVVVTDGTAQRGATPAQGNVRGGSTDPEPEPSTDRVGTDLELLVEFGSHGLAQDRVIDAEHAARALMKRLGRDPAKVAALAEPVFEKMVQLFLRLAKRTQDAWWLDRVFELHRLGARAIGANTIYTLATLTPILPRCSQPELRAYLDDVTPRVTDPAATLRLRRLELLARQVMDPAAD